MWVLWMSIVFSITGYLMPVYLLGRPPLPGLFEVFPELRFPWPRWLKDRQGRRKPCKVPEDCPFPLDCCIHPILPGEKFCCSGWGRRMLVPQYAYNFITENNEPR
jgi:hypothetical protein